MIFYNLSKKFPIVLRLEFFKRYNSLLILLILENIQMMDDEEYFPDIVNIWFISGRIRKRNFRSDY